jgi:hypothetical protein
MNNLDFDLGKALGLARPGAKWRLIGNSFEGLEWMDESDIPNEQALRTALEAEDQRLADRKVWPSSADFWANFTDAEKLAILASTIAGIILLREELRLWTGEVWSDDSRVQAGLNGLVAVGILTNDRKQAILTP